MTHAVEWSGRPAALLRPELDNLAEEIIIKIRRSIPEYARRIDGPYGQTLRVGVGMAITAFVDQLADPAMPHAHRDEVCRKLGQNEEREGRSMDTLQAAYRVGGRVAWQRIMQIGRRNSFSSATMSQLANALFDYLDELASVSLAGYTEARARSAEAVQEWRCRLLHLILECTGVPDNVIGELAALARWPVPTGVTLVAATSGAAVARPLLDDDILLCLRGAQPYLLIPGPFTSARLRGLQAALPSERLAIGVTVPLRAAVDSLRWARQALSMAVYGVFGTGAGRPARGGAAACGTAEKPKPWNARRRRRRRCARRGCGCRAGRRGEGAALRQAGPHRARARGPQAQRRRGERRPRSVGSAAGRRFPGGEMTRVRRAGGVAAGGGSISAARSPSARSRLNSRSSRMFSRLSTNAAKPSRKPRPVTISL